MANRLRYGDLRGRWSLCKSTRTHIGLERIRRVPLGVTGKQVGDWGVPIFRRRNTAPRELPHEDLLFVVGAIGVPHRDKLNHPLLAEDLYVGLVENAESVIGVRRDTGNLSWSDDSRLVAHAYAQSAAHDPNGLVAPWRCGAATGPGGTLRPRKMNTCMAPCSAPSNVPTSIAFVSMKLTRLSLAAVTNAGPHPRWRRVRLDPSTTTSC